MIESLFASVKQILYSLDWPQYFRDKIKCDSILPVSSTYLAVGRKGQLTAVRFCYLARLQFHYAKNRFISFSPTVGNGFIGPAIG